MNMAVLINTVRHVSYEVVTPAKSERSITAFQFRNQDVQLYKAALSSGTICYVLNTSLGFARVSGCDTEQGRGGL